MLSTVPLEPVLRAVVAGLCLAYICGHVNSVKERIKRIKISPSSTPTRRVLLWPRFLLVLDAIAFVIAGGFFLYCLIIILLA